MVIHLALPCKHSARLGWMKQKSSATHAKYKSRYRNARPVAEIIADLVRHDTLPAHNPQYLRYHALLLAAVPAEWHEHIRVGKLQYQGFEIYAIDSALAYRLRFLAPEIRRRLGESLPHVPPIQVKIDPGLKSWYARERPKSLPAPRERLTDAQADDILRQFFARMREKK